MVSILTFSLAAVANSFMDTSNHHYSTSIFTKFNNPKFWDGSISWRNKYINGNPKYGRKKTFFNLNTPTVLSDCFHLFKSLMIILIVISIITFKPHGLNQILNLIIYGIAWNSSFNLFYNRILIK